MSRQLPPLDFHAHLEPGIAKRKLEEFGAVVFGMTRSLDEYGQVRRRSDAVTVWGLGVHPGMPEALRGYDERRFADLLTEAPLIGEVGLDGASPAPMDQQVEVLRSVLARIARTPRLVSIHSKRATGRTLDLVEEAGLRGAILHWWLGSETETRRAMSLGCVFSVNRSMNLSKLRTAGVPLTRLLPETDHPFGNRRGVDLRQPGWTSDVETNVAERYGSVPEVVRREFWRTFSGLVSESGVSGLLPPVIQAMVKQAASDRV